MRLTGPALGILLLAAALGGGPAPGQEPAAPAPPPPEEASEAYPSRDHGAIRVRVDNPATADSFDVLRDGKRVRGAPKLLNGTLEVPPGLYLVDVNRTRRRVTVEAGRKVVLWAGELVVEGQPRTTAWYAMGGKDKLTSSGVEPLLNRPLALLPGTYAVFVDTSLTGADQALGDARVTAGRRLVLRR